MTWRRLAGHEASVSEALHVEPHQYEKRSSLGQGGDVTREVPQSFKNI